MFGLTRTLLVDGNSLLKQSFFGNKHTYDSDGKNIGTLYTFLVILRKIIKENNIVKVIVSWDSENAGKNRYEIYKPYKANRPSKSWFSGIELSDKQIDREQREQTLLWQKKRIQEYLENFYIRQIEVDEIESDDLIAFYCKEFHKKEKILIFSNDRDILQLIDYQNVSVYVSNLKTIINKDNYFLTFKHSYENLCLLKTLTGCTSDNIHGVKGSGEDSILQFFPEIKNKKITIEEIIEKAKQINEERLSSKPKKKPLALLENIEKGIFKEMGEMGIEHYQIHEKIVNLLNPMITEGAKVELIDIGTLPLDINGRTSKNLLNMMKEDSLLSHWPNADFNNFINPFLPLIIKEKDFSTKNN